MSVLFKEDMNYPIEYAICKQSIFYFMEEYLKLELRDEQCDVLSHMLNMKNGHYSEISTFRRFGSSTLLSVIALWLAMFHPGTTVALCFKKYTILREVKELLYKLHLDFENSIPVEYRMSEDGVSSITLRSIERIKFTNGSEINFIYNVGDGIRGKTIDFYLLDNCDISELFIQYNTKKVLKLIS